MFPATLQHILVPLDFSALSDRALDAAVAMARPAGAHLTLMHVYLPCDSLEEAQRLPETLMATVEGGIQKQLAVRATEIERRGVPCTTIARLGSTYQEIDAFIRHQKPDLVVMSTHGRTGLEHAMLGSVTERVVARSVCPVLVLPARPG